MPVLFTFQRQTNTNQKEVPKQMSEVMHTSGNTLLGTYVVKPVAWLCMSCTSDLPAVSLLHLRRDTTVIYSACIITAREEHGNA